KLDRRFRLERVLTRPYENQNVHASYSYDHGADSYQHHQQKRNIDQAEKTFTGAKAKLAIGFLTTRLLPLLFLFGPILRQIIQRAARSLSDRSLVFTELSNKKGF